MSDDIATLRRILRDCRTVAIVGLSADWHRPSNFAAKFSALESKRVSVGTHVAECCRHVGPALLV